MNIAEVFLSAPNNKLVIYYGTYSRFKRKMQELKHDTFLSNALILRILHKNFSNCSNNKFFFLISICVEKTRP